LRSHILVRRTCLTHRLTEPRSVRAGRGFALVARPRGVARQRATAPRSAVGLRREAERTSRPPRAPRSALSAARSGGETRREPRGWLTQVTRWLTSAGAAIGPFDTEPGEHTGNPAEGGELEMSVELRVDLSALEPYCAPLPASANGANPVTGFATAGRARSLAVAHVRFGYNHCARP